MKNARQENRENYLVFVQCGSDQMGCGDRSRHICPFLWSAQQHGNRGDIFDYYDSDDRVDLQEGSGTLRKRAGILVEI